VGWIVGGIQWQHDGTMMGDDGETKRKRGPRDVEGVSWTTGEFFLFFLVHFHLLEIFISYLYYNHDGTAEGQRKGKPTTSTVASLCSQGRVWVLNDGRG
jgi:hypothetical protein